MNEMNRSAVNRLTEGLALLCAVAAVVILARSAVVPAAQISLSGLRTEVLDEGDRERFSMLLGEARRVADSNGDPDLLLTELEESFPGRHEVWALAGRHAEAKGEDGPALMAFARAVRLEPDYLEEGSGLFLGRRIEALTRRVMGDLKEVRSSRGLNSSEKELIKTAYFIKRRLAGGCE